MVPSEPPHGQSLALVKQACSDQQEHSLWNANVSPITQVADDHDETDEDSASPLQPEGSALYHSFQSENITDTIDQDGGGPNARLINH